MASDGAGDARRERMAMIGAIGLLAVVFALAALAAILVSIHNANDAPRHEAHGLELTADEATGRQLFASTCATCHTLAATNSVGRIGPILDVVKPSRTLVLYAIAHGFSGPGGQMPAGLYSGHDAKDIAAFVATVTHH